MPLHNIFPSGSTRNSPLPPHAAPPPPQTTPLASFIPQARSSCARRSHPLPQVAARHPPSRQLARRGIHVTASLHPPGRGPAATTCHRGLILRYAVQTPFLPPSFPPSCPLLDSAGRCRSGCASRSRAQRRAGTRRRPDGARPAPLNFIILLSLLSRVASPLLQAQPLFPPSSSFSLPALRLVGQQGMADASILPS